MEKKNPKTTSLSRRLFVQAGAAIAASAAALASAACAPQAAIEATNDEAGKLAETNPEEGGTWITAACWHNCGGRCLNKVLVKDGVVVRQKTDDTHEDSAEYPQQRGCVRGKAQQQQCFGADRILHPLKRRGWQPGGGENSNGQMRGRDEWDVISWDEAIKYCCDEISRIKRDYGNEAFFYATDFGSSHPFAYAIEAGVSGWQTSSMGTFQFGCSMYGLPGNGLGKANDRFDMQNADVVIIWSSNPAWSAPGTPIYNFIQAKEAGVRFVSVDPMFNASAQMLDAEWLPVRNGTDMALMLGVAFEMLRLDEERGGVVDWEFLDKYTVGFDAEHKPADAKNDENLRDYLSGILDGTPKTAAWASEICGVEADQITKLAETLSKENNVMILHNYGFVRTHGSEKTPQMLMTLACMGGHIGRSGNCFGSAYHANCGNAGPSLVKAGSATSSELADTAVKRGRTPDVLRAIAQGGGIIRDVGNAGFGMFADSPADVELGPVKCILHGYEAMLQTSLDQKDNIAAHRAVEFVMTPASFMTTNALYSDIILPLRTEWESIGGVSGSNREFIVAYSRVTEPLGESKSDQEIDTLLLEGLGLDAAVAYPVSEEQAYYEQIAGCTVRGEDGEMVPLVTISAEDIAELHAEGEPQEGVISLGEFIDNGGYQFKRTADDGLGFIGYQDFVEDPEGNPLPSASGKFEIYCQAHDDVMHAMGFENHEAYKPYPTYVVPPAPAGWAATFKNSDPSTGEKGEFPYLMYNPHYLRRSHTVFDNCPWLRETWPNPVFIAREDAQREGIAEGDTVLVSTDTGQILRTAAVMDTLRPGVVGVPHGAWVDVDEETGIDRAGSDNYLTGNNYSGMGPSGYNNGTCRIEKYDGEAPVPDCERPQRLVAGATASDPIV